MLDYAQDETGAAGGLSDLTAGLGADFTFTAPADIVIAYRRGESGELAWEVVTKKQAAIDIIQGQPYYAPNVKVSEGENGK